MELQNVSTNSTFKIKAAQDVRRAIRYALHAKVIFAWLDERGHRHAASGCTRDISIKGAYVVATECPPRGTFLSMSVYLPAQPDERSIRVKAEGQVMRVDPAGQTDSQSGFSVHNKRVLLCDK